jgi:hypothetical protein
MKAVIGTIKVLAVMLTIFFIMISPARAIMPGDCPIGTYWWTDSWGNSICKSFGTGRTTVIEGSTENCPVGTYPWVDSWGNAICKSF